MLNAFQHPWRYPIRAVPVVFRTKPQSHEDVASAAKRLSLVTVRPAAPLMGKWACRPKPSSSWLCAKQKAQR
jgi:hypothetical protein